MTKRQLREFITPATRKFILRQQCLPGLIQPDEIADVVIFLASAASRAMTGQELHFHPRPCMPSPRPSPIGYLFSAFQECWPLNVER